MTRRERSNPEWQALIAEHQILKRKLQSKSEALLIISQDLDRVQNERDQFKTMAEKLQERCQAYKRQHADFLLTGDKAKLIQLLQDMKNQKAAYQKQNELLQQKLNEAIGDVKLLREKFARKTVGEEGIGARHFPIHEREKLVSQLEEAQQQSEYWRSEYQSQVEVANEAIIDRDGSRDKADRLNVELSRVLSGDKQRIVDIDAVCMENKYLQERVSQCLAEKNSLHAEINKYKNLISSKRNAKNDVLRSGALRSSDVVVSPKRLKNLLSKGVSQNSMEKISDLQTIVSTLLETVNDKNLALLHLRNTNKILGNRLSDMERKIKTFEVAGLWNVQDTNVSSRSQDIINADASRQNIKRRSRDSDETSSASDCDHFSSASGEANSEKCSLDVTTEQGINSEFLKSDADFKDRFYESGDKIMDERSLPVATEKKLSVKQWVDSSSTDSINSVEKNPDFLSFVDDATKPSVANYSEA